MKKKQNYYVSDKDLRWLKKNIDRYRTFGNFWIYRLVITLLKDRGISPAPEVGVEKK